MNASGFLFMASAWTIVTVMLVYSVYKVFKGKNKVE